MVVARAVWSRTRCLPGSRPRCHGRGRRSRISAYTSARSINVCPRRRGIGEIHSDLGVLDPSGGAGVLALHANGVACPSSGPRSRRRSAPPSWAPPRWSTTIATHIIADPRRHPTPPARAGVADRPGRVPGVLGDGPAVLPRQLRQQTPEQFSRPPTRLHPPETARHPSQSPPRSSPAIGPRFYAVRPRPPH